MCAAVSAMVETLMLGLTRVVHEMPMGMVDPGHADITFHESMSSEARAVIETIVAGLKDLAQSEPGAVQCVELSASANRSE